MHTHTLPSLFCLPIVIKSTFHSVKRNILKIFIQSIVGLRAQAFMPSSVEPMAHLLTDCEIIMK